MLRAYSAAGQTEMHRIGTYRFWGNRYESIPLIFGRIMHCIESRRAEKLKRG